MKIEIWGPATWNFFHTIVEKIKEEHFNIIGPQVFQMIRRVCLNLPCPECSQHATAFLNRVNFSKIHSKDQFKEMVCFFHNSVNQRKRKPMYPCSELAIYADYNLIQVFNRFVATYHTRGNFKLLAESFQRKIVVQELKKWLSEHLQYFYQ